MSFSLLDDLFGPGAHDTILGPADVLTRCGDRKPRAYVMLQPGTRVIYKPADLKTIGADENTIRQLMGWPERSNEK